MVASGCFLSVAGAAAALVRDKTLFVLSPLSSSSSSPAAALEFQLLTEPEVRAAVFSAADAPDDDNPGAQQHAVTVNCVSDVLLFQPDASNDALLALLVLVDERKLVHYEVDVAAGAVAYKSLRALPRNAVCMGVAHLDAGGARRHVVVAGVKTGEAVAMPFPDIGRDTKTLLGHTTSMIVHLAVNADSTLLLTADRDEKLRVSGFPRTALVQSYCLGHTESLTKVAASTRSPDLAVSTSLDNTMKLWGLARGALLDSVELLPAEHANSKALLRTSLAVSAPSDLVAVALGGQCVRLFAIVADGGDDANASPRLESLVLPDEVQKQLDGSEPAEVAFTRDGVLVVAYRNAPFVRFFRVRKDASKAGAAEAESADALVASSALAQLRTAFAAIEVEVVEKVVDEFEDGLKKKKIRTDFDWKTKLAALAPTAKAAASAAPQ